MDWIFPLSAILGGLLLVMALSVPIAFSFLLVTIIGAFLLQGSGALHQLTLSIVSSIGSFSVVAIPLFVLMGVILWHSRLGEEALDALDKCMGRLPARMSFLTIGAGSVFSALSGSTMANTAMLGTMLYPDLRRRGYAHDLSAGVIIASGGLAMMIPPSALAVILAAIGKISVAKVLIGAIIPGLMMAGLYAVYIVGRAILSPGAAPYYAVDPTPWRAKILAIARDIAPLGLIVFSVTGLIVLGTATPTEAAALGSISSLLLVTLKGRMSWKLLQDSLVETMQITVMAFAIIGMATAFTQILAYSGASSGLLKSILGLDVSPLLLIILMQVIVFLLGCFMEQIAIMLITLPLFLPIILAAGYDPVWFGILMLVNLETALMTPPLGLLLMVMKGIAPDLTFARITLAVVPFVICNIIVMALLIAYPELVTSVLSALK